MPMSKTSAQPEFVQRMQRFFVRSPVGDFVFGPELVRAPPWVLDLLMPLFQLALSQTNQNALAPSAGILGSVCASSVRAFLRLLIRLQPRH